MFRFAHPGFIYFLALIPLFVMIYWYLKRRGKKALSNFGDPELLEQLMPEVAPAKRNWKFYIQMTALTLLILVLAGPQFGSKLQQVKRKGVEVIIALDVSNSMMAQDIKPNRLERAKQAISKMVDRLHNDRIGLILFAGDAYTQLPITTDYASAKMFLGTISTDIVPVQGTAIGKAINLAIRSFGPESGAGRAIVVITDGENHENDAVEAASKAKEQGIIVHTIGMGLAKGAPIPIGKTNTFRKNKQGETVISKLNEQMLDEISTAGGGRYFRANNTKVGLNELFKEINTMDKSELEVKVYSDYEDQFQWLAWIIFALLILDVFILERKNKYLKKISLFK